MAAGRHRPVFLGLAGCLSFLLFCTPSYARGELVPGLSCNQVGDFAQQVAAKKRQGTAAAAQIAAMKEDYKYKSSDAQGALEYIIQSIYSQPDIANTMPTAVGEAYLNACQGTD